MEFLRDPIWQFVGAAIAGVTCLMSAAAYLWNRRKETNRKSVAAPVRMLVPSIGSNPYPKHKKRKDDRIILANLSSDFFNQFPVTVEELSMHVDRIYTPENFGASDWLSVFKRLASEGFFVAANDVRPNRITKRTELRPGEKLEPWLQGTARMKSEILGLQDRYTDNTG